MKKMSVALLAAAASLLTGCLVTSVCPFYTEKDLRFEPDLVGYWHNGEQPEEHWKFEQVSGNSYRMNYTSGTNSYNMQAHFFKLGAETFLDLFTTELTDSIQPFPIPSHCLMRVFEMKPTPRLALLDYEWLVSHLEKNPKALRHYVTKMGEKKEDERLVLTADTAELQRFVLANLKSEDAWKNSFRLERDSGEPKVKKN